MDEDECVGLCSFDDDLGICMGCGRTIAQIYGEEDVGDDSGSDANNDLSGAAS